MACLYEKSLRVLWLPVISDSLLDSFHALLAQYLPVPQNAVMVRGIVGKCTAAASVLSFQKTNQLKVRKGLAVLPDAFLPCLSLQ